ncbi:MAG: GDP-mannose 4,6-dehydratase [Proteobacteria bacterium]|nr:GDP-mannose 4,6-dehydratase [Pseudomonadota bacterium]MBU1585756.1 GDP-mannose 4,6-dehydratase [Pseudomonadota bacterium]MBU2452674.1 GDP-mannose 4,6-dehydratase [Pseudomonadota bacterium]MBU2631387.1 GDP-mannose 4,6-dehydratase [Pseudomonadota bacterium]
MQSKLIFVTGGLGFIGKHFVKRCLDMGYFVTNVDIVNYAADRFANEKFKTYNNYRHIEEDIANLSHLPESDFIVNFAAESHVDNSISDSRQFCHSNILGVQRLLELSRAKAASDAPHFIQISTDEVYGDIVQGRHAESSALRPSNPYSATKAAADMLVIGWARTYGIRYNIVRMTNNYGPNQYPEKLIPKSVMRLRRGLPALMHGNGSYIRSWLHVKDSVEAILTIMVKGESNTVYNVHGDCELSNIDVLRKIASILDVPEKDAFVQIPDRVGQDVRYSLDDNRLRALGWNPALDFDQELKNIAVEDDFRRFL